MYMERCYIYIMNIVSVGMAWMKQVSAYQMQ